MKTIVLVVLLLATFGNGAQEVRRVAKDYPKDGVYWSKSWKEIYAEVWNRNVPVFIAVHKDGSEGCAAMASLYREKRFIETSRMWVNIVVHAGTAHDVDVEIGGKKVPRCEVYFDLTCREHADLQGLIPKSMQVHPELPVRIYYNAIENKELGRESGTAKMSDLIKTMDKIQAQMPGVKIPSGDWRKAKALMAEGDEAFARKEWQKSIKAYRAVQKISEALSMHPQAALAKLNTEGELLYTDAYESQPKDMKASFAVTKNKLRKIIEDFKSLPVEARARQYLKDLEAHGH